MKQRFICVEVARGCNNACGHCYNFWKGNDDISRENDQEALSRKEILHLIKKVMKDAPIQYVAISGGEPLLRKDLPDILSDISDLGLEIIVITNGVLLTDSLLKRLPNGIYFEITLLGHLASLHNQLAGNDVFDIVIQNMARINRYGSYLTLAFVATQLNALDVYLTGELGLALGAIAIMYNRVNLSKRTIPHASDLMPSAAILGESLALLQEVTRKYQVESVCSVPIPPCVVDISKYPDIHFGWCPRGGENAYYTIGYNGLLRPCNHSSLLLGNLLNEGFEEIVSRKKCISFWKQVPKACKDCRHTLKDKCLGGCTAASYEFYGSQERLDPICEFALSSSI